MQTDNFTAFGSNTSNRQAIPWNFKEIFGTNNDFDGLQNSKDHDKSLNYEGVIHKKLTYEDIKLDDLLEPSDAESISSSFSEDSNDDESVDIDCPLSDSLNHNMSLDLKSSSSATSLSIKDDTTSKLSNDEIVTNCHKVTDGDKLELCRETIGNASIASSSGDKSFRNSIDLSSTNKNIILRNEDFVNVNDSLPYVEHSLVDGVLDLRCPKTLSKPDIVISSNDVEQFSGLKQCVLENPRKRILLSSIENTVHPPTSNRSSLLKEDFRGTLDLIKKNSPEEIQPVQFLAETMNHSHAVFQLKEDHIRNPKLKDLDSISNKNSKMPLVHGSGFKQNVFDPSLHETFQIDSTCECKMHSEICLQMIPNLDLVSSKNDVSPSKKNKSNFNETFFVNKGRDFALKADRAAVPNAASTGLLPSKCDFSDVVTDGDKGPSQMSQVLWNAFMGSRNNVSNYRCIDGQCVPVDLKIPPHTFSPLADTVVESEHFIGFVLPKCPQISFKEAPIVTAPLNKNFASSYSETQIAREKTCRGGSMLDSSFFEHNSNALLNKHLGIERKEATVSNCGNKEASSNIKVSTSKIHPKDELELRNLEFAQARMKFLGRFSDKNAAGDLKSVENNSVKLRNYANIKVSPNLYPCQQEAHSNDKFEQETNCVEDGKAIISNSIDLDLIPASERISSCIEAFNSAKAVSNHIRKNQRKSCEQLENITNRVPSNRNTPENYIESEIYMAFKPPSDLGKQVKSNLMEKSFDKKLMENKEAFSIARKKFFKTLLSFEGTHNNKISAIEPSEGMTRNATRNVSKTFTLCADSELIRNRDAEIAKPRPHDVNHAMQPQLFSVDSEFSGRGSSRKFVYEKEMKLTKRFNNTELKNGINKTSTLLIKQKKSCKKSPAGNSKPCIDIQGAIKSCSLLDSSSDYESEIDTTAGKVLIEDMVKKKEALQSTSQKYISFSTQTLKSTLSENNVSEFEKYEEDCLVSTLENPSVIQRTKKMSASKKILKRKMECESDSDDVFNISNYSDSLHQVSKKHDVPVEHSRKNLDRLDRKCSYKARARMNNSKGEVNSGLVLEKKTPTSKLYFANDDFNDAFSLTDKQTYSRASQPRKKKLMVDNCI